MAPHGKALPSWDCMVCGVADNWGSKARCRICHADPPEEHRRLVKASQKGGKGGGGGGGNTKGGQKGKGPSYSNNNGNDSSIGTFASKQLQRAREDNKLNQARAAYDASFKRFQDAQRRADQLVEQNKQ